MHDEQFEIKPNTVVYIPRNSIHQLTAEEDVRAILDGMAS